MKSLLEVIQADLVLTKNVLQEQSDAIRQSDVHEPTKHLYAREHLAEFRVQACA